MEEGKDKKPLRSKYTKEEKAYNEEIVNSLREQNMLLSDQVNLRKEAKSLSEDLLTDAKEKLEMDNDVVRSEDDLSKKITEVKV